ncbi:MAG: metallophosphatase family protein [Saprospiraceae bacterium]|nr:metallophosphatase family protein [Saprospiraceae bacterium]
MKIGLLSDTHSYLGDEILEILHDCSEIWHAGDIGSMAVLETLEGLKPVRAVYGNIDDHRIRAALPEDLIFEVNGLKVAMTHIGGYPKAYNARARSIIQQNQPDLFICGHSHILKVMKDPRSGHLHMNPGAAGHHGFHVIRTMLTFQVDHRKIEDLAVVEFGRRGRV